MKRVYFNESLLDPTLTIKIVSSRSQNRYINTNNKSSKPHDPPTERQIEVLRFLAEGLSYEEIAAKMFISISTIKSHASILYAKCHVKNRVEAIKKGSMLGYLDYSSVVNEAWKFEEMEKIKSGIAP
ncbi:response regulator transcription factor [Nostoc sp. BAE]|nr:response regulator transcription factor [Nostoc commune BAE]